MDLCVKQWNAGILRLGLLYLKQAYTVTGLWWLAGIIPVIDMMPEIVHGYA